jgi:hypothetical protein
MLLLVTANHVLIIVEHALPLLQPVRVVQLDFIFTIQPVLAREDAQIILINLFLMNGINV